MQKNIVASFLKQFSSLYRRLVGAAKHVHVRKRGVVMIVVVFLALSLGGYDLLHVSADTATLVPNGDVTAQWATGGTNDGSCTGGTHCDFVDEGTTDKTTDYVTTSGLATGTETEEYALSTVSGVSSASQVVVRIYAQTSTVQGTADTLTVNLRVNGTLQTAGTCTPASSYAACTVTFNGSWNQAAVDSMQIYILRNALGSGSTAKKVDTINIANVYATLTYVPTITYNQSAYRWFDNLDSSQLPTFVNTIGGTGTDYGYSVVQTTDGGYAVTGQTSSFGAGGIDMLITKYDAAGNVSWTKAWGGTGNDFGRSIIQTSDGGYAVAGSTTSYGQGNDDMFIAKFDSAGSLSWSMTQGGAGSDVANSIVQTSDAGYAVTGQTSSFGTGAIDIFIAKFDAAGNMSWMRTWGGTGNDYGRSIIQTSDGTYTVTGYTDSYGAGGNDMFIAKSDTNGFIQWSKTWGGTGNDYGQSIVQTSDAGYAVTGYTDSYGAGSSDMLITKYDAAGNVSWSKTWGSTGVDVGSALIKTSDGGYAVTGYTDSFSAVSYEMALVKFDAAGNVSWSKTWGKDSYEERGTALAQTSGGGYVVVGYTGGYGVGGSDVFLSTYDATGNIANCTSPMCQSPVIASNGTTAATTTPSMSLVSNPSTVSTFPIATNSVVSMSRTVVVAIASMATGGPLGQAAPNTPAIAPDEGTVFRLRLDMHINGSTVNANTSNLKLQYAPKGGSASCSVVPTGSFSDVTDSSTISYANNTMAVSGMGLVTGANDPVHGTDTVVPQTYNEKGTTTFTNSAGIASGQDGMWDFALRTNQTFQNTSYCLRVVQAGGTPLDTYTVYPELTTTAARFTQATYRWYNREPAGGSSSFIKTYGGSTNDEGNDIVQTSDGGYAVTGMTSSYSSSDDMFISKYDQSGNITWTKTWGGTSLERGVSIIQSSDGGYAVTGYTYSYGADESMFIIKYDTSGTIQWSKIFGYQNGYTEEGNDIVQTTDGGYAVTGYTTGYGGGGLDMFLAKYDASGNLTWTKTWGGSSDEEGYSLVQTTGGGYAVTGSTKSYGNGLGAEDVFLAKFDINGNLTWNTTWGGSSVDIGRSIIQTSDGGYAIAGSTYNGTYDGVLLKYNSTGSLSWSEGWGGWNNDEAYAVVQTTDGGYAMTGNTGSFGTGSVDLFLARYDNAGTLVWSQTWGTAPSLTYGNSVVQTSDGGYAVTGNSDAAGTGAEDSFIVKYDSSGNISGCGIDCIGADGATGLVSALITNPIATAASQVVPVLGNPVDTTASPTMTTTVIVGSPVTIGNPLVPLNKPLDLAALTPLSLRVAVRVDGSGIDTNTQSFKLQYAMRTAETSCSAVASGAFADVTTSTNVAYYDDARYTHGQALAVDTSDPSDSTRTMKSQTYVELNNFSNSVSPIYANEDGIWQFSLNVSNATMKGKSFCFRVTTSGGGVLTTLNVPDVAYAPLMQQLMRDGEWFSRGTGTRQSIAL